MPKTHYRVSDHREGAEIIAGNVHSVRGIFYRIEVGAAFRANKATKAGIKQAHLSDPASDS